MNYYTRDFIFGVQAMEGRAARHKSRCTPEEVAAGAGHNGVVVCLEYGPDMWNELDADSPEHGAALLKSVLEHEHARSGSIQEVSARGQLIRVIAIADVSHYKEYAD